MARLKQVCSAAYEKPHSGSRRVSTRCNAAFPAGSSTLFGKINQLHLFLEVLIEIPYRCTPALHNRVELTSCMLRRLLANTLLVTIMIIKSHFVCTLSKPHLYRKCGLSTGCAGLDSAFWAQCHNGR